MACYSCNNTLGNRAYNFRLSGSKPLHDWVFELRLNTVHNNIRTADSAHRNSLFSDFSDVRTALFRHKKPDNPANDLCSRNFGDSGSDMDFLHTIFQTKNNLRIPHDPGGGGNFAIYPRANFLFNKTPKYTNAIKIGITLSNCPIESGIF